MKLLALLALLVLRRIEWQHDPAAWRTPVERVLLLPWSFTGLFARTAAGRLLVLVVLWAAIGFVIRFGLADVLLSLPLLVLYVALLWALIGHDRLGADLNEYLRLWYLHDETALRRFVLARFAVSATDIGTLHRAVLGAIFVRAFRETFVWIIVFAVTGLPGLLALAVIDTASRAGQTDALLPQVATETRERLDWLAARLLGATLLLTGNSARAWPILDNRLLDDEDPSAALLADVCVAAAGVPPHTTAAPDAGLDIADARGLILRTQVIWILLMSVSVIVGF